MNQVKLTCTTMLVSLACRTMPSLRHSFGRPCSEHTRRTLNYIQSDKKTYMEHRQMFGFYKLSVMENSASSHICCECKPEQFCIISVIVIWCCFLTIHYSNYQHKWFQNQNWLAFMHYISLIQKPKIFKCRAEILALFLWSLRSADSKTLRKNRLCEMWDLEEAKVSLIV